MNPAARAILPRAVAVVAAAAGALALATAPAPLRAQAAAPPASPAPPAPAASAAPRAHAAPLDALSWLAGCWAADSTDPGAMGSGEQWTLAAGGTMLGMGRTVRNGRTVDHEFLQIRLDEQGRVVYVAQPARQPQATFVAKTLGDREVVFENLQHDFPQRISYRALAGDRLAARIEGLRGGALRGIDYPMRRVACAGGGREPGAVPAAAASTAAAGPADLQAQVYAAERAFAKTMADRDLAAFASHVADEAVFFGGQQPLRGRAQVAAGWSGYFKATAPPFSWEPDHVEVLPSGTLALSTGPVRDAAGQVIARFNSVWRLEPDGRWRVIFDKGSPPP